MARNTNGMGRRRVGSDRDPVINSGQRKTVGTSVYSMRPDAPSGSEFRAGMLSHKQGVDKSDAPDNRTSKRRPMRAQSMGARYAISPSVKRSAPGPDPRTQASVRTVPAVMGARRNFWGAGR